MIDKEYEMLVQKYKMEKISAHRIHYKVTFLKKHKTTEV
jgi:hypothetical protein